MVDGLVRACPMPCAPPCTWPATSHDGAEVVDRVVADLDLAGVGIDLDLGELAAFGNTSWIGSAVTCFDLKVLGTPSGTFRPRSIRRTP